MEVPGYEVELRKGSVADKKAKISLARDERKADERSVWQRDAWHKSHDVWTLIALQELNLSM